MQRLKHEHIHRVGYIRYHFAPIMRWFSKGFRRVFGRNHNFNKNKMSVSSKLPNNYDLEGQNVDGVGKLAREFSLSPVKQVIRSVYNNGMERVVQYEDGGTPKIVEWSGERYDQNEFKHLEKDIATDRSNGLHRSGHWNPRQLDKLNAYSNRKEYATTSQLSNARPEHPECSSSSSSSSDESSSNEDENHLAPPPSLYTNPDPITNTYLPEDEEYPRSKFTAYKKLKRKDRNGGGKGIQVSTALSNLQKQEYGNILSSYDSNSIKKRHPNKGRLYNVPLGNKIFNTPDINQSSLSAGGGFVYTSGEENPAITIYEPENIR